jgi:hypothetical protein
MILYPWARPEFYYRLKYIAEIKNDDRIEKLLSFKRTVDVWDKNEFYIRLQLKGNKTIAFVSWVDFDNVLAITAIDSYTMWCLRLGESDLSRGRRSIRVFDGIPRELLAVMFNKSFKTLDNYIQNYDEIKMFMDRVYFEERLPGKKEDAGRYEFENGEYVWKGSLDTWGDEEDLLNYSAFILTNNYSVKTFVEKI